PYHVDVGTGARLPQIRHGLVGLLLLHHHVDPRVLLLEALPVCLEELLGEGGEDDDFARRRGRARPHPREERDQDQRQDARHARLSTKAVMSSAMRPAASARRPPVSASAWVCARSPREWSRLLSTRSKLARLPSAPGASITPSVRRTRLSPGSRSTTASSNIASSNTPMIIPPTATAFEGMPFRMRMGSGGPPEARATRPT